MLAGSWVGRLFTWPFLVLVLLPDVALVYGMAPGLEKGQLHPRAVRLYNWLHHPGLGLSLAVIGTALAVVGARAVGIALVCAGAGWLTHVFADWCLGFGPRDAAGFQAWRART